jgi:hypothetical protein
MKNSPATVAKTMKQAHVALLKDLSKLEVAARPGSAAGLAGLRERLGTTLTDVTAHFRLEEQGGYLDAVRKREPRLEHVAQQLSEEHGRLTQSLQALVREAQEAAGLTAGLGEKVREWIAQIRHHEARENEVVQDAFNTDLGAED